MWEKSKVKCRLYGQEKPLGKMKSAYLKWLEMGENSHEPSEKLRECAEVKNVFMATTAGVPLLGGVGSLGCFKSTTLWLT